MLFPGIFNFAVRILHWGLVQIFPLAVPRFGDSFCVIPINGFWGALNIHLTTREYILTVPSWIWLRDPLTDWILFSWKMGRPWLNWDEIEKFLWTSKQMARTKLILMLASLTSSTDSVQLKSLKKNFYFENIFKGSPSPRQFIFEINVGNRRIRHRTTLKLNF